MYSFKPVKQPRISEEVRQQLREAILRGEYKPGGKLPSERELCEQFQVSRVVIREAIRTLELKGFLRLKQGAAGGAFVQDLNLDFLSSAYLDLFLMQKVSAEELMQVRQHIEPEVCRLAVVQSTWSDYRRLEEAFEQEHEETVTHEEWVARNLKIHHLLLAQCANRLFEAILTPLLELTREIVLVVKPSHRVIHDHEDHRRIIRAVASGDAGQAAEAMRAHLCRVGTSLTDLERVYREKKGLAI